MVYTWRSPSTPRLHHYHINRREGDPVVAVASSLLRLLLHGSFIIICIVISPPQALLLGTAVGVVAGMYAEQEVGLPNVKDKLLEFRKHAEDIWNKATKK